MSQNEHPDTYRPATLRTMKAGELVSVKIEKNGFSQTALCEFIKIERGMVVCKTIEHFFSKGHSPFPELVAGQIVKARAKKCFLFGKPESSLMWPRYVWFKGLDEPV